MYAVSIFLKKKNKMLDLDDDDDDDDKHVIMNRHLFYNICPTYKSILQSNNIK